MTVPHILAHRGQGGLQGGEQEGKKRLLGVEEVQTTCGKNGTRQTAHGTLQPPLFAHALHHFGFAASVE